MLTSCIIEHAWLTLSQKVNNEHYHTKKKKFGLLVSGDIHSKQKEDYVPSGLEK